MPHSSSPSRWPRGNGKTKRGERYDYQHQQARAAAARHHHPQNPCVRCGYELGPMGPHLHYDHAEDGSYLGFAHGACNRRAGAIKGNLLAAHRAARVPPKRRLAL